MSDRTTCCPASAAATSTTRVATGRAPDPNQLTGLSSNCWTAVPSSPGPSWPPSSSRRPSSRPPSSPASSWRGLLRRGLLRHLLRRAPRPPVGQQLGGPLDGDLLDRVALAQGALVSPSVTYGPKRPSLTTIGLPETGSSPSSRSGGAAAARRPRSLGWAKSAERLVERDREQLLLGLQRARVRALLDVRAVAAVLRGDLLAVRATPSVRGRVSSRSASSSVDRVERHRLEQRRRLLAVGDVRAVAAGLRRDLAAVRGRCPARDRPTAPTAAPRPSPGELVRGEVLRDRGALASSSPRCRYGP